MHFPCQEGTIYILAHHEILCTYRIRKMLMPNAHKFENFVFTIYVKMLKNYVKEQVIWKSSEMFFTADCWGGRGFQHLYQYQIVLSIPFSSHTLALCSHTKSFFRENFAYLSWYAHTYIYLIIHAPINSETLVFNALGLT